MAYAKRTSADTVYANHPAIHSTISKDEFAQFAESLAKHNMFAQNTPGSAIPQNDKYSAKITASILKTFELIDPLTTLSTAARLAQNEVKVLHEKNPGLVGATTTQAVEFLHELYINIWKNTAGDIYTRSEDIAKDLLAVAKTTDSNPDKSADARESAATVHVIFDPDEKKDQYVSVFSYTNTLVRKFLPAKFHTKKFVYAIVVANATATTAKIIEKFCEPSAVGDVSKVLKKAHEAIANETGSASAARMEELKTAVNIAQANRRKRVAVENEAFVPKFTDPLAFLIELVLLENAKEEEATTTTSATEHAGETLDEEVMEQETQYEAPKDALGDKAPETTENQTHDQGAKKTGSRQPAETKPQQKNTQEEDGTELGNNDPEPKKPIQKKSEQKESAEKNPEQKEAAKKKSEQQKEAVEKEPVQKPEQKPEQKEAAKKKPDQKEGAAKKPAQKEVAEKPAQKKDSDADIGSETKLCGPDQSNSAETDQSGSSSASADKKPQVVSAKSDTAADGDVKKASAPKQKKKKSGADEPIEQRIAAREVDVKCLQAKLASTTSESEKTEISTQLISMARSLSSLKGQVQKRINEANKGLCEGAKKVAGSKEKGDDADKNGKRKHIDALDAEGFDARSTGSASVVAINPLPIGDFIEGLANPAKPSAGTGSSHAHGRAPGEAGDENYRALVQLVSNILRNSGAKDIDAHRAILSIIYLCSLTGPVLTPDVVLSTLVVGTAGNDDFEKQLRLVYFALTAREAAADMFALAQIGSAFRSAQVTRLIAEITFAAIPSVFVHRTQTQDVLSYSYTLGLDVVAALFRLSTVAVYPDSSPHTAELRRRSLITKARKPHAGRGAVVQHMVQTTLKRAAADADANSDADASADKKQKLAQPLDEQAHEAQHEQTNPGEETVDMQDVGYHIDH